MIALTVAFEGGLVLVALGLGWLLGTAPFGRLAFGAQALAWAVVATVPPVAVLLWLERVGEGPVARLRRLVEDLLQRLFRGASLTDLALVSLLAGVGEEALFRGVIQEAASQAMSPLAGLVLASVLFGAVHALNATYFVFATLAGFYFGWLYQVTGNLLVPIVVHALYDLVALHRLLRRNDAPS